MTRRSAGLGGRGYARGGALTGPETAGVSVGQSTVTVSSASVETGNDVTVTATVKDANGAAVAGVTPTMTATGTGNTVGAFGASNAAGVATATFSSSVAEAKSISVKFNTRTMAAVAVTVTGAGGGTATTVTLISRDAASNAGGATVVLTGTGFTGTPTVKFGGVQSASVTRDSATQITCIVPAYSGTGAVDVIVADKTLTPATFEYLPAPTTTFVSHNFEDGTLGGFSSGAWGGASVAASTDRAYAGTKSCKCYATTSDNYAYLSYGFSSNAPLNEANGVYHRFYIYIDDATVTATQGSHGQIKTHLFRQGNSQPGWLMAGVGYDFNAKKHRTCIDNGVILLTGGDTSFDMGDTIGWVEVQYWNTRKSSTGKCRVWINGKRAVEETANAAMGNDTTDYALGARYGITYQQNVSANTTIYLDNVAVANGFIDP